MSPDSSASGNYFVLGIPLSDRAWDRFAVAEALQGAAGEPGRTLRRLAPRLDPAHPLPAEELLALRTLNAVLRWLARRYLEVESPGSLARGREAAAARLGRDEVDRVIAAFVALFPPVDVRPGGDSPDRFLAGPAPAHGPDAATLELLMLFLNTTNPAAAAAQPLFDDAELQRRAGYLAFVTDFERHLEEHEPPGSTGLSLFSLLRAPLRASPHSLAGQLRWIRDNWGDLLPDELRDGLLTALDVLKEIDVHRAGEPGPPPVLEFGPGSAAWGEHGPEPEAFSRDADWMSNVVLMAKSVYVWLDQLSREHGRPVHTLADVPDDELDRLAGWGVTGAVADRPVGTLDRLAHDQAVDGQPRAAAQRLLPVRLRDRRRPGRRAPPGATCASGPGSGASAWPATWCPTTWASTAAGWSSTPSGSCSSTTRPTPPTASAAATSATTPGVAVRIEDGYWDQRDAAVVFQRVDEGSGQVRYIYHGNDGTSMPWNDTAQLNFLLPEVRRGGHPTHPARGPHVPDHPLRRGHDPGQEALPAPVVPRARRRRRHPLAGRARHEQAPISTASSPSSSGARSSTAWPPRRPTPCCWPRPSG